MRKVLFFTAPWCTSCAAAKPAVHAYARTQGVSVEEIDIDQQPQLAASHRVMGLPTVLVHDGQAEVARTVGALPRVQLEAFLRGHLA